MRGASGRGAGDEHEVSKNAVSTLGLAEDDTERSLGFGVVGAAENCAWPTITARGLLSSWPAPAANSASASSFSVWSLVSS